MGKAGGVCGSFPRSFSSQHLSMASIAVVDTPGFHNPRHQRGERAATFEELCHNYVHERLQALFYEKTFVLEMERYREVRSEGWEQRPGSSFPAPGVGAASDPRGPCALPWCDRITHSEALTGGVLQKRGVCTER